MAEYLVARNEGGINYGLDTELLRRTERGVYRVSCNTQRSPIKLLHIRERLSDANASATEIGRGLLSLPSALGKPRSGTYNTEVLKTPIGCKWGRIHRPVLGFGSMRAYEELDQIEDLYLQLQKQTVHVYEKLIHFSNSVDLHESNLGVFGNETRDLILLACLQVEALFKYMMYENVFDSKGRITDYWMASAPARLPDYRVRLTDAYGLGQIRPFASWESSADGYQPLPWYQAYNDLKHNAAAGTKAAKLGYAVEAVVACLILQSAIHKPRLVSKKSSKRMAELLDHSFSLDSKPNWSPGDFYWTIPGRELRFLPITSYPSPVSRAT